MLPRIDIPTRDDAPAETHAVLDTVGKRFGFVPNLFRKGGHFTRLRDGEFR
jgi:hypothetical protein